jgi:DNA-binding transcriptional ArsR family regulator
MADWTTEATSAIGQGLGDADVAPVAELFADRARTAILLALSDGRALAAGVLARAAGLSPSGASAHLAKLAASGIVAVERRGRFRYYSLRDPAVVVALEALAAIAPPARARSAREAYTGRAIRVARICYDHLAGVLGVALTDALVQEGTFVEVAGSFEVTPNGTRRLNEIGIDVSAVATAARRTRRPLTRACLDWSERRPHLAGALGAALANRLLELQWLERRPATRALQITNLGRRELRRRFGFVLQ